ncbi:penicillin-binding transpeptidase domain-containing protein [Leptospira haakeii]|uniref:beta-lactamase n=1 Tax=Leptospira haakeii TaxID=2023198 RepID=A0ABX4PPX8_9LEPT|nr:penicillin-binding transpeptidase domain-containing protein [Leptospira haakeii]PKA17856.1 cell division protein FtsI [Leptospira haakeii]PKA21581.1 cell division protein FtsI [Leptospira haakeii]
MNSRIYYKAGIFFAVILLCTVGIEAAPKFSYSYLDETVKEFESKNSISSVVLMEMDSGKVEYIYRPEIAVSKKLPPGSLVKTFSALTLLKYKDRLGFSPEKKVLCKGRFYPKENLTPTKSDLNTFHLPQDENGKEYLRCSLAKGHGEMDLRSALVQSCNVYFLTSASFDPDLFYSKLHEDWSLGKSTRSRLDSYLEPSDTNFTSISSLRKVAASIGEGGLLLSPLKISQLYSSIWKEGPRLSPYRGISQEPVRSEENPYSGKDLRWITSVLSEVPKTGTLKDVYSSEKGNLEVLGGKTGTGTKFMHKYETHGWTVLSFRKDRKSYVLTVFVDNGSGGNQAKSLAAILLDKIDSKTKDSAIKSGK